MDDFNMNTMNGKTAKKIVLENVTPKMEELGFKEKKNKIIDTNFIREKENRLFAISCGIDILSQRSLGKYS